jgi:hypothetical protein
MIEFITSLILIIILVVAIFWLLDFLRSRKEPWNKRNGITYPKYHALVIIVGLSGIGLLLKTQPEPIYKLSSPTYKVNFNLQGDIERSVDPNNYKFLSVKSKSFPPNVACDNIEGEINFKKQCKEIIHL